MIRNAIAKRPKILNNTFKNENRLFLEISVFALTNKKGYHKRCFWMGKEVEFILEGYICIFISFIIWLTSVNNNSIVYKVVNTTIVSTYST